MNTTCFATKKGFHTEDDDLTDDLTEGLSLKGLTDTYVVRKGFTEGIATVGTIEAGIKAGIGVFKAI